MGALTFHLENASPKATTEFEALLTEIFGRAPERRTVEGRTAEDEKIKPATLATAAALILAVPGAVDSSLNIAQCIHLTEKIERLIAKATEIRQTTGATVRLELGNSEQRDLSRLTPGEVLDAASGGGNASGTRR
jgi:hypothetical protein